MNNIGVVWYMVARFTEPVGLTQVVRHGPTTNPLATAVVLVLR